MTGLSYIGTTTVRAYQADQAEKERQLQTQLASQQEALETTQAELEALKLENQIALTETQERFETELDTQKRTSEMQKKALINVIAQEMVELEDRITEESTDNLSNIVKDWQPAIARVQCYFPSDTKGTYTVARGSGIAIRSRDSRQSFVLTNRHVITNDQGQGADSCDIRLPGNILIRDNKDMRVALTGIDMAYIGINNPQKQIANTVALPNFCTQLPSLGDEIVVLGYPGIGARSSITATEGIISGYDNDYFITSAKVEHGNSGGAAILIKDNCLLGIPTYVKVGSLESLARILDIWAVYGE